MLKLEFTAKLRKFFFLAFSNLQLEDDFGSTVPKSTSPRQSTTDRQLCSTIPLQAGVVGGIEGPAAAFPAAGKAEPGAGEDDVFEASSSQAAPIQGPGGPTETDDPIKVLMNKCTATTRVSFTKNKLCLDMHSGC